MAKKTNNEEFIQYFKKQDSFTINDAYRFFRNTHPNIKRSTVNWRIYHLVQQGVLQRIGRGVYVLGQERNFVPTSDKKQKSVAILLKKQFPLATYCCWRLSVLKEFYQHFATIDFLLVEVEKETLEPVKAQEWYCSHKKKKRKQKKSQEVWVTLNLQIDRIFRMLLWTQCLFPT